MRVFSVIRAHPHRRGVDSMSDPTERYKIEPHPISSHRTPEEIAEDEAGPIGDPRSRYAKPAADKGLLRKYYERTEPEPGSTPQ